MSPLIIVPEIIGRGLLVEPRDFFFPGFEVNLPDVSYLVCLGAVFGGIVYQRRIVRGKDRMLERIVLDGINDFLGIPAAVVFPEDVNGVAGYCLLPVSSP